MKTDFLILVIGAGASGMMAAYAATRARPSCAVILEKEARAGRKLLATGNGRCNLYNARPEKVRLHGSFAPAFERMLADTPPEALRAEFDRIGLCCREESEGRVYPYSGQASAVLDALRFACARQGAEIVPDARAAAITPERNGFVVESAAGTFRAKKVILAAGGCAAPSFGADGGGVRLLRALGHETAQERPSIAPLRVPAKCIRGMKGIRLRGGVTLLAAGVPVQQESGELIFSDGTVSGVCVMQLARKAGELTARRKRVQLSIDLAPGLDTAALLRGRAALLRDEPAERLFTGLIPGRAAMCLLRAAEFGPQNPAKDAPTDVLAALLHDWRLPVTGTAGFAQAQVTAGGLTADGFNETTLESLIIPGLYACGEALDFDGDCGGYNLMWAWLSGLRAGGCAAAGLQSASA